MYAVARFINEPSCSVRRSRMLCKRWIMGEREREPTEQNRTGPSYTEQDRMVFAATARNAGHTKANFTFTGVRLGVAVAISASTTLIFCSYFTTLCCGGSIILVSHIFICILCVRFATSFNYLFKGSPRKFIFIINRRVSIHFVMLDVCTIQ